MVQNLKKTLLLPFLLARKLGLARPLELVAHGPADRECYEEGSEQTNEQERIGKSTLLRASLLANFMLSSREVVVKVVLVTAVASLGHANECSQVDDGSLLVS